MGQIGDIFLTSHLKIKMLITSKNIFSVPDGLHRIAPNFFLKVRGTSRIYLLRYTDAYGKRKDKSIGSARKIKLKDAKDTALEFRQKLAEGETLSPKQKIKIPSFKSFAEETIATIAEVKQWKNKIQKVTLEKEFNRYVYPIIGDIPVNRITRDSVLSVLTPIWKTKPGVTVRIRYMMGNILAYAVTSNYLEFNPATWKGNLSMFLPPANKVHTIKHFNAPSLPQLKELVQKIKISDKPAFKAILFGALTATRTVEFSLAEWVEFDFENKVWSIPPKRRKDGKKEAHRVPLSNQAIKLLLSIPRENTNVFVSKRTGSVFLPGNISQTFGYLVDRAFTAHGIRSTFRDWCSENEINDTVAEKCLMHATGNAVNQAYQRSDLLEQRRSVMQAWADEIMPPDD